MTKDSIASLCFFQWIKTEYSILSTIPKLFILAKNKRKRRNRSRVQRFSPAAGRKSGQSNRKRNSKRQITSNESRSKEFYLFYLLKRAERSDIHKYSIVNSDLFGWNIIGTQFAFTNQHQIFVPEMRRDNLNDLHEAASDESNSEDHDGGENKKAVTTHPLRNSATITTKKDPRIGP